MYILISNQLLESIFDFKSGQTENTQIRVDWAILENLISVLYCLVIENDLWGLWQNSWNMPPHQYLTFSITKKDNIEI